ncbi:hypothetical protein EMUCRT_0747 [Ehrlichia cf. muris str. EmCRT]|uniref:Uncharacterized protein n=1 Tax=Ehrlichia cf. muris str. EmCRT TaxID=1359167 RepID=A0A0F3N6E8_9RICK|nr:hypothetical protein EMUCRT_0747 [Ehrlichia cf. muris str. EmCRT]
MFIMMMDYLLSASCKKFLDEIAEFHASLITDIPVLAG